MFEINIYYRHTGYKRQTFHPCTLRYVEVLAVMQTIVALTVGTTKIRWVTIDDESCLIWARGRCYGFITIQKVNEVIVNQDTCGG